VKALWREARKVLADERGSSDVTDAALLETLCRRFLNAGSDDGPPHTIGYLECPECGHGKQIGAGRQFDVDDHVMERARCDARVLGDLTASHPERAVSSVTPRMREQVLAVFGGSCAVPGCRSSRCIEVHHLIPQAEGGPHEMWNLAPLCDGHHVADHLGLLKITGRAPFDLTFEWMSPPMRPACLPRELAMVIGDDVPAGTPGLDPDHPKEVPTSSQRWAVAVSRVVTKVARDAEPRAIWASRRSDVPAGTRDSPPSEGSIGSDVLTGCEPRASERPG
jgi:5-methylcytosine-specific restriction endonuclease McrA